MMRYSMRGIGLISVFLVLSSLKVVEMRNKSRIFIHIKDPLTCKPIFENGRPVGIFFDKKAVLNISENFLKLTNEIDINNALAMASIGWQGMSWGRLKTFSQLNVLVIYTNCRFIVWQILLFIRDYAQFIKYKI